MCILFQHMGGISPTPCSFFVLCVLSIPGLGANKHIAEISVLLFLIFQRYTIYHLIWSVSGKIDYIAYAPLPAGFRLDRKVSEGDQHVGRKRYEVVSSLFPLCFSPPSLKRTGWLHNHRCWKMAHLLLPNLSPAPIGTIHPPYPFSTGLQWFPITVFGVLT